MASIMSRNLLRASSRCLHTTSYKCADKGMPLPIEHATGLERRELEAIAAGNENPFDMRVIKRVAGATKDSPTEVPSAFEKRIMGCVCEEGATSINWMWLYRGQPKRCECGHWFTLVKSNPV
ncbi:cytochrome c oxidase subunit 5B, mitochondrial [Hyalella azteca]|uniref:Cytochrome c oxidase subunit 5B, mitochondrial n=1 Tax=Hyalella azteca TaxID=294128 RepID=A0A8B7N940_HYAAZ|nr:cytochrome c oxidase subunit 5B, mitochondrial [Hyalella azteca]